MSIFNFTPSSASTAARAICIGQGVIEFNNASVILEGYGEEALCIMYGEGFSGGRNSRWSLRRLIESCLTSMALDSAQLSGDIEKPTLQIQNYSKDVMELAKSHKRQEVETTDQLLFGIELEFNHSNYSLKDLSSLLGMGIFKHDSSVDGEFVTLPYTYADMVSKITALSESFDKLLSANDTLTPLSGVGMHIHLSRKGLSDGQLDILRGLFSGEFTPYISYLCERYPNRYCNYRAWCGNRYVALNESNENTVEIRAFLSPVNAAGILRNLKLVNAWLELANMSVDEWEVKYPAFAYDADVVSEWWGDRTTSKSASSYVESQEVNNLFWNEIEEALAYPISTSTSGWEAFEPSPSCDSEVAREAQLYEASLGGSDGMMPELTPEELADLTADWRASQAISANEPW